MLVSRCFHGSIVMVEAPNKPKAAEWPYQFIYQTGAYAKAFLNSGC